MFAYVRLCSLNWEKICRGADLELRRVYWPGCIKLLDFSLCSIGWRRGLGRGGAFLLVSPLLGPLPTRSSRGEDGKLDAPLTASPTPTRTRFGETDRAELIDDAVTVAIRDQMDAGLEVITDGEQTRLDFNLSFYGFLQGIELESASTRRFGPPAHDQRGRHKVTGTLAAPRGLGTVEDFERLKRLAPPGPVLKASVPGPYTLSGRLAPNAQYPDRLALTEALLPIVRRELEALVKAGCREITVDEPSMSCYAHREEPKGLVTIFNRTVEPIIGRCRLSTHLCFGNYKGRAIGPRRYAPMFPAFLGMQVDEFHLEMASREFAISRW